MRTTKKLYQWDTDQKLINCVGKYVDFPIGDGVYRIDVIDKECIIPDELLQVSGTVKVYECMEYGTVKAFAFYINPRPKPPDYVFTPTERLTFEGLVKKVDETIADLQKRAASGEFNGSDYVITESDYDAIAAKTAGKLQPTIGELARTLETEKTDREQSDISLQKDISGKLSEPVKGLAVGKYFRVSQIDENGHAVLEAVDAKTIGVQDVKVNGDSIVNVENGVADLPIANSQNVLGLMKVGSVVNGIGITADGSLAIDGAINTYIDNRQSTRPITPINLDYAVKAAMCDGKGAAWTAEEQVAARERMGIPGDYELIEEIVCDGEATAYTRTVDVNGNPYNLLSVYIEFEIEIGNSYTSSVFFRAYDAESNTVLYDGSLVNQKSYVSYLLSGVDAKNGMYQGWIISGNVASYNKGGSNPKRINRRVPIISPIKKIYIMVGGGLKFISGDKIRIYGVRA